MEGVKGGGKGVKEGGSEGGREGRGKKGKGGEGSNKTNCFLELAIKGLVTSILPAHSG